MTVYIVASSTSRTATKLPIPAMIGQGLKQARPLSMLPQASSAKPCQISNECSFEGDDNPSHMHNIPKPRPVNQGSSRWSVSQPWSSQVISWIGNCPCQGRSCCSVGGGQVDPAFLIPHAPGKVPASNPIMHGLSWGNTSNTAVCYDHQCLLSPKDWCPA